MTQSIEFKELYVSPSKEKNELKRWNHDGEFCICCEKPVQNPNYIHMTTSWMAVPQETTEEDLEKQGYESQGLFPIGSTCAKKMGKKYIVLA